MSQTSLSTRRDNHPFRNRGVVFLLIYPVLLVLGLVSGAWAAGIVFGTAILLLAVFGRRLAYGLRRVFDWWLVLLALGFCLWASAASFWSTTNPIENLTASLVQAAIFLGAILWLAEINAFRAMSVCTNRWVQRMMQIMVIAGGVGFVLFGLDWFLDWPLQGIVQRRESINSYSKGVTNLMLLLIPVLGYFVVQRRWFWVVVAGLELLAFAAVTSNSTARVALGLAVVVLLLSLAAMLVVKPVVLRWLLGIFITGVVLTTPLWVKFLTHYEAYFSKFGFKPSFLVRLEIWRLTNRGLLAHPFLGHGWRSSRALSLADATGGKYTYLNKMGSDFHFYPHNQMLQIWYDLGIGGALMMVGLVLWVTLRTARLPGTLQAFAFAAIAFVLTTSLVNYDLATDAWWAILVAMAGLFGLASEGIQDDGIAVQYRQVKPFEPKNTGEPSIGFAANPESQSDYYPDNYRAPPSYGTARNYDNDDLGWH
ncbi:MAG: O-antigen ligase family protein [Candidatus Symbiobacter sp.]|nr:O-antigen ligase family protein [Candidatus Symbiobacter sp.]